MFKQLILIILLCSFVWAGNPVLKVEGIRKRDGLPVFGSLEYFKDSQVLVGRLFVSGTMTFVCAHKQANGEITASYLDDVFELKEKK